MKIALKSGCRPFLLFIFIVVYYFCYSERLSQLVHAIWLPIHCSTKKIDNFRFDQFCLHMTEDRIFGKFQFFSIRKQLKPIKPTMMIEKCTYSIQYDRVSSIAGYCSYIRG